MKKQENTRNNENRDKNTNNHKEDISKKASQLEERVFGKDLKNITFRQNKGDKVEKEEKIEKIEKIDRPEKNNIKLEQKESSMNFNILRVRDENNINSQRLSSNSENEKKLKVPKKQELNGLNNILSIQSEYVKVGNNYVKVDKKKGKSKIPQVSIIAEVEAERALDPFEEALKEDPQYVIEFSRDIFEHLKKTEHINKATFGFMGTVQTEITDKMRAILIDWLVDVHYKFELLPETLFFAINLIDRYLSLVNINLSQFQLIGVTAMLIASKYEEIYAPEIRDFIYITERALNKPDIIAMELKILAQLDFDVLFTSPYKFLQRFHLVSNDNSNMKTFHMAHYLTELSLMEYGMLKYSSSLTAASAIYLARKIYRVENGNWNNTLQYHTGYKETDLISCSKDLCKLLEIVPRITLKSIYRKFSTPVYKEVSSLFFKRFPETASIMGDSK